MGIAKTWRFHPERAMIADIRVTNRSEKVPRKVSTNCMDLERNGEILFLLVFSGEFLD